jgi:uncharacterized protein (TIGR00290 family)
MDGKERVILSWSGGKDSMMALDRLNRRSDIEIVCLLTTITEEVDRVSMHGVRHTLLNKQAESLGLKLEVVTIPPSCSNATYEERMTRFLERWKSHGVMTVAFGDLFLEDIRRYREQNMQSIGMCTLFPVWGEPTRLLAEEFIAHGFHARLVCVDTTHLNASFCGEEYGDVLPRLPPGVDPCGENGEFHTFVYGGPLFTRPIEITTGERVERPPFVFTDLVESVR